MKDAADFRGLPDEIAAHPGTIAKGRWDSLAFVHSILLGNERELLAMVQAIDDNTENLGLTMASNVGPEAPRTALYGELIRRLHNYVARS